MEWSLYFSNDSTFHILITYIINYSWIIKSIYLFIQHLLHWMILYTYTKSGNPENNIVWPIRLKHLLEHICSGCDSMDVGRSGEIQGVVGRVWEAEIIWIFDDYAIFLKKKVEKLEKKVKNELKSVSCGRNLMILGAGSMKTPQLSVSTWNFRPKPGK